MNRYGYTAKPFNFTLRSGQVWVIKDTNDKDRPPSISISTPVWGEKDMWNTLCESQYHKLDKNFMKTDEIYEKYYLSYPER